MVMPQGVVVIAPPLPLRRDVQTTTECDRRRITARNCSGAARAAKGGALLLEWGGTGGCVFEDDLRVGVVVKGRELVSVELLLARAFVDNRLPHARYCTHPAHSQRGTEARGAEAQS